MVTSNNRYNSLILPFWPCLCKLLSRWVHIFGKNLFKDTKWCFFVIFWMQYNSLYLSSWSLLVVDTEVAQRVYFLQIKFLSLLTNVTLSPPKIQSWLTWQHLFKYILSYKPDIQRLSFVISNAFQQCRTYLC